jgi:hypothetical protein
MSPTCPYNLLPTGRICAFVKPTLQVVFYRQNGLQNRFTADFGSADYAGVEYIPAK